MVGGKETFQGDASKFDKTLCRLWDIAIPSRQLWVGNLSQHITETMLLEKFYKFGNIASVDMVPGRNYAFVNFIETKDAVLALRELQGVALDGVPIKIEFSKLDKSDSIDGAFSYSKLDRSDDKSKLNEVPMRMGRIPRTSYGSTFEMGSKRRLPEGDHMNKLPAEAPGTTHWQGFPLERTRRHPHFGDPWRVDNNSFLLPKKHKIEPCFEGEVPEYPLPQMNLRLETHAKLLPSLHERDMSQRSIVPLHFEYKGLPDRCRDDYWKPLERSTAGPALTDLVSSNKGHHSSPPLVHEEWKWEGTLAKGGKTICRARCFPVGKAPAFMLPEFLDCTARTSVEMLAKHYHQAASSWVVFFAPETDSDIPFYNEFMHYLQEKQRAAVSTLGEKTALFFVSPSEFSEQVLKVPGKVSISGVILNFEQSSFSYSSLHHSLETSDPKAASLKDQPTNAVHKDSLFGKPTPQFASSSYFQNDHSSSTGHLPLMSTATTTILQPLPPLPPAPPAPTLSKLPLKAESSSRPSSSFPALQSKQLAQLASLLTHQTELAKDSAQPSLGESSTMQVKTSTSYGPLGSRIPDASLHTSLGVPQPLQSYAPSIGQSSTVQPNTSMSYGPLGSQIPEVSLPMSMGVPQPLQIYAPSSSLGQQSIPLHHLRQHPTTSAAQKGKLVLQSNEQQASCSSGAREADIQKNLQETLQLAAFLLQKLQDQKNAGERKQ